MGLGLCSPTCDCGNCKDRTNTLNQIIKEILEGVVQIEKDKLEKELNIDRFAHADYHKGFEVSKNDTINHLESIIKKL